MTSQPGTTGPMPATGRWSLSAGVAALLLAPLLIGGVHLPVRVLLTLLLFVAFMASVLSAWRQGRRLVLGAVGWGLGLLLLWTFVQWLPLPAALVQWLAPTSAEARMVAAELLGAEPPSWMPLTLDGSRTAEAWVSLLGYWLVYMVVVNDGELGWRRQAPLLVVLLASVCVMATGLLHLLVGPSIFLGFHPQTIPRFAQFFHTTFVNTNHGASAMLLGVGVSLALWWGVRTKPIRWLFLGAAVLLGLATVATAARACTLLLAPLVLGCGLAGHRVTRDPEARRHVLVSVTGVLAATVLAVFLLASDRWMSEWALLMEPASFLDAAFRDRWAVGWATTGDHWLVGTGLGAFEVASPTYTDMRWTGWMGYAHNIVLQVWSDWGVLLGSLGAGLMVTGFGRALWRLRGDPAGIAVGLTLMVLLIENLVDFSLHIPGVGLLAMTALGWMVQASHQQEEETSPFWIGQTIPPSPTVLLLLGGALALTIWHARTQHHETWDQRARLQLAGEVETRVPTEEVLLEHPLDFHLFGVASALSWDLGEEERAWALMDRAVELAPASVNTLLARARLHRASGHPMDAMEDLMQVAVNPGGRLRVVRELLSWPDGQDILKAVLAHDEEMILTAVTELRIRSSPGKITEVLEWGMSKLPNSVALAEALAEQYLWTPGRTRELDKVATRILAEGVRTEDPVLSVKRKRNGYLLQGFVHKNDGKVLEAYHLFQEAASLDPQEAIYPLLLAGGVADTAGDLARLRRILDQLRDQEMEDPRYQSSYHRLLSGRHELEGHLRQAVEQMHRAVLFQPKIARHQARLADLYDRLKQPGAADNHRRRYQNLTGRPVKP